MISPSIHTWMRLHGEHQQTGVDGNIRFIHEVQTGQYGYPTLFKVYLGDHSSTCGCRGWSGTGDVFRWTRSVLNNSLGCPWCVTGVGHLFTQGNSWWTHLYSATGGFYQVWEDYGCRLWWIGRLFIGSWGKSGFKGGDDGYISRVVPKGWKYQKFPNLEERNK